MSVEITDLSDESEKKSDPKRETAKALIEKASGEAIGFIDRGEDNMAVLLIKGLAVYLTHRLER